MQIQSIWQSTMFIVGTVSAIVEGFLGIMLAGGWIDVQLAGSITAALAIIQQWCNANNPSLKDQYIVKPDTEPEAVVPVYRPVNEQQALRGSCRRQIWFTVGDDD